MEKLYINNNGLQSTYNGILVGDYLSKLIEHAALKTPYKNEWAEEDGIDVDLYNNFFNVKDLTLEILLPDANSLFLLKNELSISSINEYLFNELDYNSIYLRTKKIDISNFGETKKIVKLHLQQDNTQIYKIGKSNLVNDSKSILVQEINNDISEIGISVLLQEQETYFISSEISNDLKFVENINNEVYEGDIYIVIKNSISGNVQYVNYIESKGGGEFKPLESGENLICLRSRTGSYYSITLSKVKITKSEKRSAWFPSVHDILLGESTNSIVEAPYLTGDDTGWKIDGNDLASYGITILRESSFSFSDMISFKEKVFAENAFVNGIQYLDDSVNTFKGEMPLYYMMTAESLNELIAIYDLFILNLTRDGKRILESVNGEVLNFYYVSNSVKLFKKTKRPFLQLTINIQVI